jgi:capsular exopolysaccharide synthesis family protein
MNQIAELQQRELQSVGVGDIDAAMQAGGVDMWGIASRRKWLLVFGLLLGLGLGYIYLLQADPVYESIARVLIETKKPIMPLTSDLAVGSLEYSGGGESKHPIMITSPEIIIRAFQEGGLAKLPTFAELDKPLELLSDNLTVEPLDEEANVFDIKFRGPNPDDTQKSVESILKTYREFLKDTYKDTSSSTKQMFMEAKDELLKKVEMLQEEYAEFKKNAPLFVRDGDVSISLPEKHRQIHDAKRLQLREQLAEVSAKIIAVEKALRNVDNQGSHSLEAILITAGEDARELSRAANDRRDLIIRDRLLPLIMTYESLAAQYGPDYPEVRAAKRALERFNEFFPDIESNSPQRQSGEELKKMVTDILGSLRQKKTELEAQLVEVEALFQKEEAEARQLASVVAQDRDFQQQIETNKQMLDATMKNLTQLIMVSNSSYDGYKYSTLGNPGPGQKVAPMAYKVLPISAFLGILGGFAIAYLVDVADKAFRTPDEVSSVMRLPVVGHIPLIDVAKVKVLPDSEVSPVMITVHRPKSPQAESYRAVRTALYFNNRDAKHRVIQVTSPMPGDGKSTLAANLAVTIAQSGKTVLLLDADFRRPTLHKVFGFKKVETGLASVVSGDTDPQDAFINIPEVPNMRIMGCGPRPNNPSELLSSQQLADTLELFREQFDYVIIDTPPVLAVSDPCAVAARVDGVILTFRIHKRARPLAVRARDALISMGANVIGVVVNGVDHEAGGYYSQYRYGYTGYRYAYNYRYGQGYGGYGTYGSEKSETQAINKYFDDDPSFSRRDIDATIEQG